MNVQLLREMVRIFRKHPQLLNMDAYIGGENFSCTFASHIRGYTNAKTLQDAIDQKLNFCLCGLAVFLTPGLLDAQTGWLRKIGERVLGLDDLINSDSLIYFGNWTNKALKNAFRQAEKAGDAQEKANILAEYVEWWIQHHQSEA